MVIADVAPLIAAPTVVASPVGDYPRVFRRYLLRTLQLTLDQVRSSGDIVTEAVQTQVLHILDFALRLDDAWPLLRELLFLLLPMIERLGEQRRWLSCFAQALPLCRRAHDGEAESRFAWTLGVLSRRFGDLPAAERYLTQSQTVAAALADQHLRASALTELAYLMQMQHRLAEATALIQQAHALLPPDDPLRAPGYAVLGDVLFDEQQWGAAAAMTEQAIALWATHGQTLFAASGWRGLARIRWRQGDVAAAVACYERAIACCEAGQERVQQAITCIGLGGLYAGLADGAQALGWLAQAEQILLPLRDTYHLAMLYTNYGIAYRLLRQWQPAVDALQKSLAYYGELNDFARQINSLTELATVYQEWGKPTLAQQPLIQAQSLLASLTDWLDAKDYQALITQMMETFALVE